VIQHPRHSPTQRTANVARSMALGTLGGNVQSARPYQPKRRGVYEPAPVSFSPWAWYLATEAQGSPITGVPDHSGNGRDLTTWWDAPTRVDDYLDLHMAGLRRLFTFSLAEFAVYHVSRWSGNTDQPDVTHVQFHRPYSEGANGIWVDNHYLSNGTSNGAFTHKGQQARDDTENEWNEATNTASSSANDKLIHRLTRTPTAITYRKNSGSVASDLWRYSGTPLTVPDPIFAQLRIGRTLNFGRGPHWWETVIFDHIPDTAEDGAVMAYLTGKFA
jgi:hypothetical protein